MSYYDRAHARLRKRRNKLEAEVRTLTERRDELLGSLASKTEELGLVRQAQDALEAEAREGADLSKYEVQSTQCCCQYGAAVKGEHPEFECYECPRHGRTLALPDELCKRHKKAAHGS